MHEIAIKSHINGRVRLKSALFNAANEALLFKLLQPLVYEFRHNVSARSLILLYDHTQTNLEAIMALLHKQLHVTLPLSSPVEPTSAYCPSCSSCSSCELKTNTPQSWKRKLITFGALSGYALYVFIKETVLGVVVISSPFSLTAMVALCAAIPLLQEAYSDVKAKRFTLQSFMAFSLIAAIFGGEVMAAFEIIYILRGGMLLEEYTAEKSKREIHNLIALEIKKAYVLVDDVELEVDLESIKEGDIVVSRSGEKIPVDGQIIEGKAEIDEASINGRSEPAFKEKGDIVYANTLLHRGRIYIRVSAIGENTYLSRVIAKVEASLALKSPSELSADRLASKLLKLGTFLTGATFLLTGSWLRAFSVMIVMSCPCATILAASTAISAGIARGAKQGILIKGGESLELVAQSEVFCFDKTGTLTTGQPRIVATHLQPGVSLEELITYAACAEQKNHHPIAQAILKEAKRLGFTCKEEEQSEILAGLGVKLTYEGKQILVGNAKLLAHNSVDMRAAETVAQSHLESGQTVVYVSMDGLLLGLMAFEHEVREGTEAMLEGLKKRGVKHLVLLTGDEEKVARAFGKTYGFDAIYANVMPEEKAEVIEALKRKYNRVVMVGDGVNDTIAMSTSDVAISFASGGSEAAIEVSNIAITNSHPSDILKLYDLSSKSLHVISQNYWIGTSTNLGSVAFAAFGALSPVMAGAMHIAHTVGIMANSSRIAWGVDNNS